MDNLYFFLIQGSRYASQPTYVHEYILHMYKLTVVSAQNIYYTADKDTFIYMLWISSYNSCNTWFHDLSNSDIQSLLFLRK